MKNHFPKKTALALLLSCAAFTSAHAGTGFMLGVVHNFGGSTGLTFKLLSTDQPNRAAAVVGLSYFPGKAEQRWGLDVGLGFNFPKAAVTLSYDLLNAQVQFGLGAANTQDPAPVAATPAPAPVVVVPVVVPPVVVPPAEPAPV